MMSPLFARRRLGFDVLTTQVCILPQRLAENEGDSGTRGSASLTQGSLTEALLRGPKTASQLERLTGITQNALRGRRRTLGIVRDETIEADRS